MPAKQNMVLRYDVDDIVEDIKLKREENKLTDITSVSRDDDQD